MAEAPANATRPRLPAFFFGHGNPMNAIQRNPVTEAWAAIGAALPRPRAVLCISAHWYLPATTVTAAAQPQTIHDFGGFRARSTKCATRLGRSRAGTRRERWRPRAWPWTSVARPRHGSVLVHVFLTPACPVQLGIDETQAPAFHYELGRWLARCATRALTSAAATSGTTHAYAGAGTAERSTGRCASRSR
jgi:4,5-DOPA dioxygenase extradiol